MTVSRSSPKIETLKMDCAKHSSGFNCCGICCCCSCCGWPNVAPNVGAVAGLPNVPNPPDNPEVVAVLPNPLNNGADEVVFSPPPKPPAPNVLNVGAAEAEKQIIWRHWRIWLSIMQLLSGCAPKPEKPLPKPAGGWLAPNPVDDVVCVPKPNDGADVEAVFVPKPVDPNAGAADGWPKPILN